MNNIVSDQTATAQWQNLVLEAEESTHCHLDETSESYLVFTLMRFTQRPELLSTIMATGFLNGMNERGLRRHDELRDVGDQCLLIAGLFPQNAKRRLVHISYFVNLGRSAYQQIHDDQYHATYELYGQLASDFVPMMDVLLAIRSLNRENETLSPLDAFELWENAGSQLACNTLLETSNANPISNPSTAKH